MLLLKATIFLWWRPRRIEEHFAKQGIRGPPYRLFIGNVKEIVGLMLKASSQPMPLSHNILPRVLSFYHHWKKIYGGTFLVWFGPTARLTVADPDLIREIFGSNSEFYEKNESHPLVRQLEGDGLLSLKGEKWAYHRKIISPTFHMENLKLLIPVMGKTVVELTEKWSAMSNNGEVEVEVSDWFQTVTEDVITRTAFGSSYEDGKAVFGLQAKQMVLAAEAFRNVFIPGFRFLPTRQNMSSWKLDKEIKSSLVKLIGRRGKENPSSGGGGGCSPRDFLGLMIGAGPASTSRWTEAAKKARTITVQDIVEECKTFFFAGKQTTSNMLTWTTVLLAMHTDWQDRAREEVLHVCGSRDIPTRDHIPKLKTLGMILNESLRLYPPAVATIRRAKADVELGPHKIPKGTELLIPILAVHHDPALWGKDAAEFNPARFSDGAARAARHPMAFIPFGLGARTCIGQNLALLQAKLVLAIMLQRFSFTLAPKYRHAPTVLMLLYPQHGAPVVFRRLPGPTDCGTAL
ncbi:cytochrome P450 734A1-like [Aristolochia californica]|uniref:cytochrome P450 734A1-like n=1 Tax=Aristolochia californica TaxID=171875 RepID=UPI0035D6AAE0